MNEISNKTLAVLVGIAIVVSLVGLLAGRGRITGMAVEENETGAVNVTVTSDIDINATDASIDFGTMINQQCNTSEGLGDNITIQNIGATPVDIDYWADDCLFGKQNASDDACVAADNAYKIKFDKGGCSATSISTYTNTVIGFGSVAVDAVTDCETDDEFTVLIQACVPVYETPGAVGSTLNFKATQKS